MKRSLCRILALATVISLLISISPSSLAATASSVTQYAYYKDLLYTFGFISMVSAGDDRAEAHTIVYSYAYNSSPLIGISAPVGYIGAQARLYKDVNGNAVVVYSDEYKYNSFAVGTFGVQTAQYSERGNYFSSGLVKLYNGNGYDTYVCNLSPIVQASSPRDNVAQAIEEPEFIAAIGSNGEFGYVKSAELSPTFSTIEDALAYNDNAPSEINLYDENGQIIGVFKFGDRSNL